MTSLEAPIQKILSEEFEQGEIATLREPARAPIPPEFPPIDRLGEREIQDGRGSDLGAARGGEWG